MKAWSKEKIKLNYSENNGGWWMAKGDANSKPNGQYPKLKVDFNHSGEFTFLIQNAQGAKFAKDAFVPKANKNNPVDFAKQFTVTGQGSDTLKVIVANEDPTDPAKEYAGGDYHYELRFTDKPPLDPIITNGGCCSVKNDAMVYYALGGVALLALLFLVFRPILFKR